MFKTDSHLNLSGLSRVQSATAPCDSNPKLCNYQSSLTVALSRPHFRWLGECIILDSVTGFRGPSKRSWNTTNRSRHLQTIHTSTSITIANMLDDIPSKTLEDGSYRLSRNGGTYFTLRNNTKHGKFREILLKQANNTSYLIINKITL